MISDESLKLIAEDDHVQCGDASAMAKELLALRKAREGWKLVPVVLTGGMTNAMTEAISDDLHNVDVWKSTLSAAPEPE